MDDAEPIDPDVIELVVQLCTRIGIMMEDVSALALDATREGLEERVAELIRAIRTMNTLAAALESLFGLDILALNDGRETRSNAMRKRPVA